MDKQRPNVIVLVADDHRHEAIHWHGNEDVKTPVLDDLAKRGVSFSHTYINGGLDGAVCAPSRACLNSGCTIMGATVSQSLEDTLEKLTIANNRATLGETFRKNGYHSYAVGKWHNDKESFQRSFQDGNNIFFGGMSEHRKVPVYPYDPSGEYVATLRTIETTFSTELFTNTAVEFLDRYNEEEPFFLYVAYTSPHDPRTAPEPYASMYDSEGLNLPPNVWEQHPFDNGEMTVRDEHLTSVPRKLEEVRQEIADYYAMITHMDAQMGRIVEKLREKGQLEHTIVVYTSDHGLAVGQHGLMGKQNVYEHSIRIPWLMSGPGIAEGVKVSGQVMQMDIFPTLCSLAHIPIPLSVEGRSMADAAAETGTAPFRDTVYSLYKDTQRMVKDKTWKYIRYRTSSHTGEGSDEVQLFCLDKDPWEIHNLAYDAEYADKVKEMQAKLHQWMLQANDPFIQYFSEE